MIEIKSDKIITPNGLRSGCLYIDNGLIDGFLKNKEPILLAKNVMILWVNMCRRGL